jgi:hypothetical protein
MTCPKHPKYQGKAKLSHPCRGCWEVYGQRQGWTADDMRCELEWRISMWKRLRDQVLMTEGAPFRLHGQAASDKTG